ASPNEIIQALKTGTKVEKIHYGNTIKSNVQILTAFNLGIRDFATDCINDTRAIAKHAPGSNVFCRIATDGKGAVWGLSKKFGCSLEESIRVLNEAKANGLQPAGISLHIGSQQMEPSSWDKVFEELEFVLRRLKDDGIKLKYINLGGGLPPSGYLDKSGNKLNPPINEIIVAIKSGMCRLQKSIGYSLNFIMEPGRYLVADFGVIKTHVVRLAERVQPNGDKQNWLFLNSGKFNGLYETDALTYPVIFPNSRNTEDTIGVIIAGPTCDSDDVFNSEKSLINIPVDLKPGDPVWILSCGAYSASYTTLGFNGFEPL
ncbi:ornithine decarboxylase, partial [Vibrio agarivorans]